MTYAGMLKWVSRQNTCAARDSEFRRTSPPFSFTARESTSNSAIPRGGISVRGASQRPSGTRPDAAQVRMRSLSSVWCGSSESARANEGCLPAEDGFLDLTSAVERTLD